MLVGNTELIKAPVRTIKAKAELVAGTAFATQTGNPLIITNSCSYPAPMVIQTDSGATVYRTGKNIANIYAFSAWGLNTPESTPGLTNNYGTTISTTEPGNTLTITQTQCPNPNNVSYVNGYFIIGFYHKIKDGETITVSFDVEITNDLSGNNIFGFMVSGVQYQSAPIVNGKVKATFQWKNYGDRQYLEVQNHGKSMVISNIQIEYGNTATEYTPAMGLQSGVADENGNVEGITSLKPMTLYTDTGAEIIATYEIPNTGNQTFTANDMLKSITLDRTGESKFFGFGVCQKANIKLLDVDRTLAFTTSDTFNIYFDDVAVSPRMKVSEVHRDENTNEISITLYDKLKEATKYTFEDLGLQPIYNILDVLMSIAGKLDLYVITPYLDEFYLEYPEGANFDGAETLLEVLNAIAEATQTIYYINAANELVFMRLDKDGPAAYTIDREQYITLDTKTNRRLTAICSATQLGENYQKDTGVSGTTQYVWDNPFWELREDVNILVENAVATVGNMTINQFDCSWRGNYLVEPGDKIALIAKDGSEVYSYLVNDTIKYDGSYSQHTMWEYMDEETEHANPTNLGDAMKQTFAKVDKANKEITIVASETKGNTSNISQLFIDTTTINASVQSIQSNTKDSFDAINGELKKIGDKVDVAVSEDDVRIVVQDEFAKGVDKVSTGKGYTFDDEGLTIEDLENPEIITQITNNGMGIYKDSVSDNNKVLTVNNQGVIAKDLHAITYLHIGTNSRFEDYNNRTRTGCFWIGGMR